MSWLFSLLGRLRRCLRGDNPKPTKVFEIFICDDELRAVGCCLTYKQADNMVNEMFTKQKELNKIYVYEVTPVFKI